jgi:trans-2-enoyl-CoA reductase
MLANEDDEIVLGEAEIERRRALLSYENLLFKFAELQTRHDKALDQIEQLKHYQSLYRSSSVRYEESEKQYEEEIRQLKRTVRALTDETLKKRRGRNEKNP